MFGLIRTRFYFYSTTIVNKKAKVLKPNCLKTFVLHGQIDINFFLRYIYDYIYVFTYAYAYVMCLV